MAEATRFLLRLLLISLLTARGYQAITARAGFADNTESKDELDADFEGDSIINDAGEESSWVNGPTEESSLEPNETSSYNLTASELPEAEPLKQDRSVLKHQNLSNRFQQATTDNPVEPQSCLPTDPDQPPCPTQGPLQLLCPPPQQPICPPNNSKTHVLPELSFHLRRLLKLLNYKPEVLEESPPPHMFLPQSLQAFQQHGFVPKRPFGPKLHEYLPEWSPVSPQHHGYPPDEPRHYDYHAQEHLHQSAQVPRQYEPEPRTYGIQFLEPHSRSYPPREFREPHRYLPQEFWEPQPRGYQSQRPQPHEDMPRESQPHGYPVQDPVERQMPQHEKPVKPQVHRAPRYKSRWPAHLPQRPHYVLRPWHPANKAHFKTRQPSSSQFYYVPK